MRRLILLTLTLFALACVDGVKVIAFFPFPGKSQSILGEGYVRELSEAGHEVTFVTMFPPSQKFKNTRIIDISDVNNVISAVYSSATNISGIMENKEDMSSMGSLYEMMFDIVNKTIQSKNLQKFLNDPSEIFDVIIVDWLFLDVYAGLQAVFQCPLIWASSTEPHSGVFRLIDEAMNPAYNADMLSTDTPPFDFIDRAKELFMLALLNTLRTFYIYPTEESLYIQHFAPIIKKRGHEVPPLWTLVYNASLMLGNSHVSLGQPTRLPQSYKDIAGYHIDVRDKPLSPELKKLLDTAEHGVIYFSMGSNLRSKDWPDQLKKDLIQLFGKLKYTVIWKFEEELSNLPKNLHILKWAPQPSILAHPNCKLFITHGGLLSTTEAIHFGVPIIGIPVFGDQFLNIKRAENKGFALGVKLSYTLVRDLEEAIEKMFSTPQYVERMKELSLIYHDRPVPPGKELVHWVEHVVKTKGAPHLRSLALHVPWYQKAYLDLALVVFAVLAVVVSLLKRLCSVVCSKKKVVSSKKNN